MKLFMSLSLFLGLFSLASAHEYTPATYEVPVPEELAAYATYELPHFEMESYGNGKVKVSYRLPTLLTGNEHKVKFYGTMKADGTAELEGNGKMTCFSKETGNECHVKYENLDVNLDAVRAELKQTNLPQDAQEKKLAVSTLFSGDLQGIVKFEK